MALKTTTTRTTCSGCMEPVRIRLNADAEGTATVLGKKTEVFYAANDDDCDLVMWDCPSCGHADSFEAAERPASKRPAGA